MPSIADALELVKRDPPMGFVTIAVLAAAPPSPAILVDAKGRKLLLPDWTAREWLWYGSLARKIAAKQPVKNDAGQQSKSRALQSFVPFVDSMELIANDETAKPDPELALNFYTHAVKVVIASNAASTGETAGQLALEAFGEAVAEAPSVILNRLKERLANFTITQKAVEQSKAILSTLFGAVSSGLLAGLGPTGIILIGVGLLWYISSRGKKE